MSRELTEEEKNVILIIGSLRDPNLPASFRTILNLYRERHRMIDPLKLQAMLSSLGRKGMVHTSCINVEMN